MRLGEPAGGAWVDLRIAGYQFPELTAPRDRNSWDANWLTVTGSVLAGDDAWSFTSPTLTTADVGDLARWLRRVAAGAVAPAPGDTAEDPHDRPGWLSFLEPDLSFAVAGYDEPRRVRVLVGLSHGCAPPSADGPGRRRVVVSTSRARVADAATALDRELAAHPAR